MTHPVDPLPETTPYAAIPDDQAHNHLLTYHEASEELGGPGHPISIQTVRALVKSGRLPLIRLTSKIHRIRLSDIREYIRNGGDRL